jgi:hypothetical protein
MTTDETAAQGREMFLELAKLLVAAAREQMGPSPLLATFPGWKRIKELEAALAEEERRHRCKLNEAHGYANDARRLREELAKAKADLQRVKSESRSPFARRALLRACDALRQAGIEDVAREIEGDRTKPFGQWVAAEVAAAEADREALATALADREAQAQEIRELGARVDGLTSQLKAADETLRRSQEDLTRMQADTSRLVGERDRLECERDRAAEAYVATLEARAAHAEGLRATSAGLKQERDEAIEARSALIARFNQTTYELDQARKDIKRLWAELDEARRSRDELARELEKAQAEGDEVLAMKRALEEAERDSEALRGSLRLAMQDRDTAIRQRDEERRARVEQDPHRHDQSMGPSYAEEDKA